MAVRYRCVSCSWKPISPKLKTESTICCASPYIPSTLATASCLYCASLGGTAAATTCAASRSLWEAGNVVVASDATRTERSHARSLSVMARDYLLFLFLSARPGQNAFEPDVALVTRDLKDPIVCAPQAIHERPRLGERHR